jgi:hypothetical protein
VRLFSHKRAPIAPRFWPRYRSKSVTSVKLDLVFHLQGFESL